MLAGVGIGCGIVAAAVLTRAMSSLLFGVSALDPLTYVAVAIALGRNGGAGELPAGAPRRTRRSGCSA